MENHKPNHYDTLFPPSHLIPNIPEGYSRSQVTGMIKQGQNSHPKISLDQKIVKKKQNKKKPMPNLRALNISKEDCILFAELRGWDTWTTLPPGHYHWIFRLFWIPKKLPTEIKPPLTNNSLWAIFLYCSCK